jgi:DNA/RNA-binding domain of Phe-tRNA-synthetase-like protein
MRAGDDPEPELGWVSPEVREEFPELRLFTATVATAAGPSSPEARHRLRLLSDRFTGARAVGMRREPIPSAYRIFYRHIGLDPDETRPPGEAAAVERLLRGGFRPSNRLDDALLIALAETGVPLWALDADALDGPLGIRTAAAGERLERGPYARPLPAGQLVVADADAPVAPLFGEVAPERVVKGHTARVSLYAVQVSGVPAIHVEEALWTCASLLVQAQDGR